jgi:hypothetical protein
MSSDELAAMQNAYSDFIRRQMQNGGGMVYRTMGNYYSGANKRQEDLEKQSK